MPMRLNIILNKIYKKLNNDNLKSWDLTRLRINTSCIVWELQDSEIPHMAMIHDEFLIYQHVGHNGDSSISSFKCYEDYTNRILMIMDNGFIVYGVGMVNGKVDYIKK